MQQFHLCLLSDNNWFEILSWSTLWRQQGRWSGREARGEFGESCFVFTGAHTLVPRAMRVSRGWEGVGSVPLTRTAWAPPGFRGSHRWDHRGASHRDRVQPFLVLPSPVWSVVFILPVNIKLLIWISLVKSRLLQENSLSSNTSLTFNRVRPANTGFSQSRIPYTPLPPDVHTFGTKLWF